jgi:threonylcarbamoyladenosine tRNA methylthiotransferase MtaB
MKVHLRMLGCRLNQSEIDTMARQLVQQGHVIVDAPDEADQVIVNTCAVTNDAVKSGRRMIADLHEANTHAEITVTGCHAQIAPQDIAVLPGVKRVVGNREKNTLVTQITGQAVEPFELEPHERDQKHLTRTRAFVKVQDGCDNACTFCVTTVARGEGVSRASDDILNEIAFLCQEGYQEAVLTGVHLGSYGHDWGNHDGLVQLVQRILDETTISRLRLSSLEPWDLSPDFFGLWQNPRLCPHLHLPLQSGCDATLKRMRRNTNRADFADLMQAARAQIPNVRITSDVIVGFPGETEDEFAQSYDFIQAMDFAGLHVFRYSIRPNTPAAKMRGQVPNDTKKQRSQQMITLGQNGETRFAQKFIGQELPILWENITGATPNGFLNVGYSHNYIRVQATHPRVLTNLTTPTRIIDVVNDTVNGVPVVE